jgi:hypothetical protein
MKFTTSQMAPKNVASAPGNALLVLFDRVLARGQESNTDERAGRVHPPGDVTFLQGTGLEGVETNKGEVVMDIGIGGPPLKGISHEVEAELDGGEGHHKKHLEDRHADETEIAGWCET